MRDVTLCICGCGEPAVLAARHSAMKQRRITEANYTVDARGYETPCWIYKNPRSPRALGQYNHIRINGKQVYVHRAMYEQEVGPIPDGLVLDHLCHQPPCIRPDHLDPVTDAINVQRGRHGRLDRESVLAIRHEQGNVSARFLSEIFEVDQSLIYLIWNRKIWRNV